MNSLLFLDVEAHIADAVVSEKAVHPLRLLHGISGDHRDAVEGHIVAMQRFNSLHRHGVGATSISEAPVGVVDVLRAIHTDADNDAVAPEAVAPRIVDQRGVGLHVLGEVQPLGIELLEAAIQDRCRFVVPTGGQGEGFPGMPYQSELRPGVGAFKNPLDQQWQKIQVEDPLFLPIWQIAIGAIEVAQRGRLHNHEADGPEPVEVGPDV